MALSSKARRRWFGSLVLALALGMLLAGETVLKGRFPPVAFLFYWLICMVLTVLAIVIALADARASNEKIVREQRQLLESTLEEIQQQALEKKRDKKRNGN
jgi:hypothetical protein